jgi:hypothetical protein
MKKLMIAAALLGFCYVLFAADELSVTTGWSYSKSGRSRTLSATATRFDVTGNGAYDSVRTIATTATQIKLDGVTTYGHAWFKNIGPTATYTNGTQTNYVQVGTVDTNGGFVVFLELNTNQSAQTWLGTTNLWAKATGTNSVYLDVSALDR